MKLQKLIYFRAKPIIAFDIKIFKKKNQRLANVFPFIQVKREILIAIKYIQLYKNYN